MNGNITEVGIDAFICSKNKGTNVSISMPSFPPETETYIFYID